MIGGGGGGGGLATSSFYVKLCRIFNRTMNNSALLGVFKILKSQNSKTGQIIKTYCNFVSVNPKVIFIVF